MPSTSPVQYSRSQSWHRIFGSGRTVKEIARELSLSPPTVSTYRARILVKLRLRTTADLVRYAVQNRLAR